MKQFLLFFLLISFSSFSQNFKAVDSIVKTYPKLISDVNLAERITADFSSDIKKVRAIYSWLAFNIRYDLKELLNPKRKTSISFNYRTEEEKLQKMKAIKNETVYRTLSTRKAVCEGYAQSFSQICDILKIENEVIQGYVRNSSEEIDKPLSSSNHAWNAVKINNTWKYFDATWGAGASTNGKWKRSFNDYHFDIPKEKLFFTHYPQETLWQLRVKRFSKYEFYKQPIYKHQFLNSDMVLISNTSGIIKKNSNGEVEIRIKNLPKNEIFYIGFDKQRFVKKPIITTENSISTLKIKAPLQSEFAFLVSNKKGILEFKLQ